MALIPYLSEGDSILASHWNTLFEELDRKITLAMDSHSLCFWRESAFPFMGQRFFFLGETPFFSTEIFEGTDGFINYSHPVFESAALATVQATGQTPSIDHSAQIVLVNKPARTYYETIGRGSVFDDSASTKSFFDFSLGCTTKSVANQQGVASRYKVAQLVNGFVAAELERTFDSVEMIVDGKTQLDIPGEWNKYRFFRVHNLGSVALTVNFAGVHSVVVPAYGSKCVRRTTPTTGYLDGWNHFHRFISGDIRFYCHPLTFGISDANDAISSQQHLNEGARGNNVYNPSLVYRMLWAMNQGEGPGVFLDYRQFWDASSLYCPDYFATPSDSAILGDFIHHKGIIGVAKINGGNAEKRTINFRGYGSVVADFAAAGITAVETPQLNPGTGLPDYYVLSLTASGTWDLVSVSSNMICGRQGPPALTFTNSYDLPAPNQPENFGQIITKIERQTNNLQTQYTPLQPDGGEGQAVVLNSSYQSSSKTFVTPEAFSIFSTTLGYIENWNSDLQTNASTFSDFNWNVSGFGLTVTALQSLPLDYCRWTTDFINTFGNLGDVFTPGIVRSNGVIDFEENSATALRQSIISDVVSNVFPEFRHDTNLVGGDTPDLEMHGAFHSPRVAQRYGKSEWRSWGSSGPATIWNPQPGAGARRFSLNPNFNHYKTKSDGTDSTLKGKIATTEKTSIKVLAPYSGCNVFAIIDAWWRGVSLEATNITALKQKTFDFRTEAGWVTHRQTVLNDDNSDLEPIFFDYIPLTVDHYNNLASVVNAVTKVRQLHFIQFYSLGITTGEGAGNRGIFGAQIYPLNQYAGYTASDLLSNVSQYDKLVELGVTVRTESDFPQSYRDLIAARARVHTVVEGNGFGDTPFVYDFVNDYQGKSLLDYNSKEWRRHLFGSVSAEPQAHFWFTIEDVRAKALALGFQFIFQRVGIPVKLEVIDVSGLNRIGDWEPGRFSLGEMTTPARFPSFTETDQSIEWLKAVDGARIAAEWEPADILSTQKIIHFGDGNGNGGNYAIFEMVTPDEWRKTNFRNSTNPRPTQPANFQTIHRFLYAWNYGEARLVFNPEPHVQWNSNNPDTPFSKQSNINAEARSADPVNSIRFIAGTIRPSAEEGLIENAPVGGSVVGLPEDIECAEITFMADNWTATG